MKADHKNGHVHTPWQEQVDRFLVAAGTNGVDKTTIVLRFKSAIDTPSLNAYLDALWEEQKVEKFSVPHSSGKGKPKVVWRATTKILE